MAAQVTVYTTGYCPYCSFAKRLLGQKAVSYREIDVSGRDDLRTWLRERSGQRTVPQIFVNGASIGGFTELSALDRQGKLDPMLAQEPSSTDPELRA